MTARTEIVALLTTLLPTDVRVLPYARSIDAPDQSTVMLRLDEVRPSPIANGVLDYDFALLLVAAQTSSGAADDELDELLADVVYAISTPGHGITWKQATRATFEEKFPAFEVSTTISINKEQ